MLVQRSVPWYTHCPCRHFGLVDADLFGAAGLRCWVGALLACLFALLGCRRGFIAAVSGL